MTASETTDRIVTGYTELRDWQEDLYRDLHAHPELSHQETRTAGIVVDQLRGAGYEVRDKLGGTGVVGVLANGPGPVVLVRADMDGLPVREATGLDYASRERAVDTGGHEVPVMHACGHDVHVACLLGAARLFAEAKDAWSGTLITLFQPAEETGDGAQGMVADGLDQAIPRPDVALAQHVLARPAGTLSTHPGPFLSMGDSLRITVHGRGSHGSMPHLSVDPAVLASMIVVRLQTVVSREVMPGEFAVLTVGRLAAGTKSNIIDDHAVLELNLRTYSEETREVMLSAIRRTVEAECAASGSPKDPEIETLESYPLTDNDPETTEAVNAAFAARFGDAVTEFGRQSASEDFSRLPDAFGTPYTYWGIGGIDPVVYEEAAARGTVGTDVPANHAPTFAPTIQPTLETGTAAIVTAALAWLGERKG